MPRGLKSTYIGKQQLQATHIEAGYEKRGVRLDEAEKRAGATVNKLTGGGRQNGSGCGRTLSNSQAPTGRSVSAVAHPRRS